MARDSSNCPKHRFGRLNAFEMRELPHSAPRIGQTCENLVERHTSCFSETSIQRLCNQLADSCFNCVTCNILPYILFDSLKISHGYFIGCRANNRAVSFMQANHFAVNLALSRMFDQPISGQTGTQRPGNVCQWREAALTCDINHRAHQNQTRNEDESHDDQ